MKRKDQMKNSPLTHLLQGIVEGLVGLALSFVAEKSHIADCQGGLRLHRGQ